ncbi:MAG: hypothetical protein CMF41_01610, partial [Legionellales bacterium]
MASRTSHLVNPEKGVLLYENAGTKAELISVHAVSHDGTKNPALSFAIDTNNSRPLNFEKSLYSLSASITASDRLVDLDSRNNGKAPIYDSANNTSLMGSASGPFASGTHWPNRYLAVDPWMTVKPSEYGNASDSVCSLLTWSTYNNSSWYYYDNILDDRAGASNPDNYYHFFNSTNNVSGQTADQGINYYDRGWAADQYTNMFMGWNNNAYMSFGGVWNGTGYGSSNRSSDSFLYQRYGTGFDSQSYESQTYSYSPLIYADGGVFVVNLRRYNSTSASYVHIIPIRYYFGDLPSDKASMTLAANQLYLDGGNNYSQPISNNYSWGSYFYTPYGAYQWHKYNKANDKYYFCFKNSTESNAGIWEWEWVDMTNSASVSYGAMSNLTGNGPAGNTYESYTVGSWQRVADYPLDSTTA